MNMIVSHIDTARKIDGVDLKLAEQERKQSALLAWAMSVPCRLRALSDLGHRVVGTDIDRDKVESIAWGQSPIHEDRLGELLTKGVSEDLLHATTNLERAVLETDVTFVSVGTPTSEDGGCDTRGD